MGACTAMIVDDDPDIRDIVSEILADQGYRVVGAANGLHALRLLREGGVRPDVILLDVMMPEMDGWAFRAEQQQDPALAPIPVVVFTAHEVPGDIVERMGVAGFLKKPIRLAELLDTFRRVCPT
jgi:CheY-like chemotaxis protein